MIGIGRAELHAKSGAAMSRIRELKIQRYSRAV
jgi:hypothetical protein